MKQKLTIAGILLLAAVLLAGALALFARRRAAEPANISAQQAQSVEVIELRDADGPRSVLYQYRDWDCMVAEVTAFRGAVNHDAWLYSEIDVEVKTPLHADAPAVGSRITLYGAAMRKRPEATQGRILLWGDPDSSSAADAYYRYVYCPLGDGDTLDVDGWLEDGMALDAFSALRDSLCAHLAAQGASDMGGALDFLSFAVTEEGALYRDWAKRALGAQLSQGENIGLLLSEYDEPAQADLHIALIAANQALQESVVTGIPEILDGYREKTGRTVSALLRCDSVLTVQVMTKTGAPTPDGLGTAWVDGELYIPYQEVGIWSAHITEWTTEPDGALTVRYTLDRTDLDAVLAGAVSRHTGVAVLRFVHPNPHAPDCALALCENHWDESADPAHR